MNAQKMLYDVPVRQLNKLDSFVGNSAALERAIGTRLDGATDDDNFCNAARALFGRVVDETLECLHEGQPGYLYAQTRKKIDAAMRAGLGINPRQRPADELDNVVLPTENINGSTNEVQPQQPL